MSGIVGVLNEDGCPVDPELLNRLVSFLAFRGPDRSGSSLHGSVALGHTLLATTWEAYTETQPSSLDGKVFLTADCRIDGRDDLRAKLLAGGRHVRPGANDAELILHAYHTWETDCVQHLIGDFAFAIWDSARRRLFCARDHSGVKLFYYAHRNKCLVFSNTLNCVRLHPCVSDRLNELAVLDFLLWARNLDNVSTTYADVRLLPPAHTLTWDDGAVSIHRYWHRPVDEPIRFPRAADYVDQFLDLARIAIRDRLRINAASVQMSGGLDSTLLAAIANEVGGQSFKLQAHSLFFRDHDPENERAYTEVAARRIGIPVRFVCFHDFKPFHRHAEIAADLPEPVNNALTAMMADLYYGMSAHSRVSFYGEGPDNLLGYEWKSYLDYMHRRNRFHHLAVDLARSFTLDRRIPFAFKFRRSHSRPWIAGPAFPDWIRPEMVARYQLKDRWDSAFLTPVGVHPYHPESYGSMDDPIWNALFVSTDQAVTRVPVEVRHPFLDIRLARFLLAVPVIPWCRRKLLVRHASRLFLPEKIWNRPKTSPQSDYVAEAVSRGENIDFVNPPLEQFSQFVSAWPPVDASTNWSIFLSAVPTGLKHWWDAQQSRRWARSGP